jgi:para-nitrobenzyl esterase
VGTIVTTKQGKLQGQLQRGVETFKGIPFAQPPIGDLRFQAPQPPRRWKGVRMATSYGPAAPQIGPVNRLIRGIIGAAGSKQSQDCLYLNVWTPGCDRRKRPVMFWIHGGAFILGSGSTPIYQGTRLARRGDVVVVTINYRLGALGFLSWDGICPGGGGPPANLGTRDQIAALEWVRDNISKFGGDPGNVTVFGESAGAMSTGTLLGTPAARGLFHKAILQSGAAHNVSQRDVAARVGQQFLDYLEVSGDPVKELLEVPVTQLMRAQARTTARVGLEDGIMAWQPCVDDDLIPEQPLEAIGRGVAADIPVLIGTNRDEFKLFMAADRIRLDDRKLDERLRALMPGVDADGNALADRALEAYARAVGPRGREASERWAAFQSDRIFHYPAARLADLQADHQPRTFAYLFEWVPPLVGRALGSCHGLELPFVFGGVKASLLRAGLIANPSAARLCDQIQDAWIAFAREGDPGHDGLPDWPAYSRFCRYTMTLGDHCTLREDPHQKGREFWEPLARQGEAARMF